VENCLDRLASTSPARCDVAICGVVPPLSATGWDIAVRIRHPPEPAVVDLLIGELPPGSSPGATVARVRTQDVDGRGVCAQELSHKSRAGRKNMTCDTTAGDPAMIVRRMAKRCSDVSCKRRPGHPSQEGIDREEPLGQGAGAARAGVNCQTPDCRLNRQISSDARNWSASLRADVVVREIEVGAASGVWVARAATRWGGWKPRRAFEVFRGGVPPR